MPEANDIRTFVQGAEQAEARGDHLAAEQLLRQALALQESSLGSQHPAVVNTLNNLAIACEMNGNLTDAEAYYRRAYAIAVSSFPPADPFVTTSRENLEQFCAARAVPFKRQPQPSGSRPSPVAVQKPASPPRIEAIPPARIETIAPPRASAPAPAPAPPAPSIDVFRHEPMLTAAPHAVVVPPSSSVSQRPSLRIVAAVLIAVAAVGWLVLSAPGEESASISDSTEEAASDAAVIPPEPAVAVAEPAAPVATATEPPRDDTEPPPGDSAATDATASTPAASTASTAAASATAAAPTTAAAPATPTEPPLTNTAATTPPAAERSAPAAPRPPATTASPSAVTVVNAELCRTLTTGSVWKCAPASGILAPGPVTFYTRVASPRDTTIEHRWYRGDQLHQRVPLRIRANPSGYRTFSRASITVDRSGSWKVELRTQDGELLDEKAFAVQP